MAFAAVLLGAVGGIAAAVVALAMGAGLLTALSVYALGGGALAALLIGLAALRPAPRHIRRGYVASGARTEY
ncbi:hypothetical protein [Rhodosalinus sp.]|uniref:hypothetical protein n=1 Tax=Rhodosalinus sp. TaxID=2047741 RepID=UPI00397897D2